MLDKPRIYLFSPTRLINSIKHEHLCKILFIALICFLTKVHLVDDNQSVEIDERPQLTIKFVPRPVISNYVAF